MGHQVTLELPDEIYESLARAASAVGQPLGKWILARLRLSSQQPMLSEREREAAMAELLAFAGCVNSGDADAADNERIDADLVRAYENEHTEEI